MALTVHSLASGSSGNSMLIKGGNTSILIDAGIGIRKLTAALDSAGVEPAGLSATFVTHEHSDHIGAAVRIAKRYGVPIIANSPTLEGIAGINDVPHKTLELGEDMSIKSLNIRPFPVSHDARCPVGYSISCEGNTVCFATDTGRVTPRIRAEAFLADLLILESNHDVELLMSGPYPRYLKKRVMGDWGHLSNETASNLLLEIAETGKSVAVWLAHLSDTNNSPKLALSTAKATLSSCLKSTMTVEVALRDVPSLTWGTERRIFQLSLFGDKS
ncbi:MAG: MBL fold metallo-hydrolase [Armatimonadota bacterium]